MILTNAYAEKDKKGIEDRFFLHEAAVEQCQPRDGHQHYECSLYQPPSGISRIENNRYHILFPFILELLLIEQQVGILLPTNDLKDSIKNFVKTLIS
jgi:hypothetical protein